MVGDENSGFEFCIFALATSQKLDALLTGTATIWFDASVPFHLMIGSVPDPDQPRQQIATTVLRFTTV